MDVYRIIGDFYQSYAGEKRIIGKSEEGRDIYAFFVGEHRHPLGISQYAMHAREWVTALIALEHIRRGVPRGGVWFVPLVNPDGALLCLRGTESVSPENRAFLRKLGADFSLWKANARAVDLNVNFAARWGTGRKNVRQPAAENYIGTAPFCAAESSALKEFTLEQKPDYTVSWHTKGEEIYWRFHQPFWRLLRDRRLARVLRKSTGYPLKSAPHSAGGYKDWCVEKLHIPAFTVEAGSDFLTHPIGEGALKQLITSCGNAVIDLANRI